MFHKRRLCEDVDAGRGEADAHQPRTANDPGEGRLPPRQTHHAASLRPGPLSEYRAATSSAAPTGRGLAYVYGRDAPTVCKRRRLRRTRRGGSPAKDARQFIDGERRIRTSEGGMGAGRACEYEKPHNAANLRIRPDDWRRHVAGYHFTQVRACDRPDLLLHRQALQARSYRRGP
jgi:hypothetical protein